MNNERRRVLKNILQSLQMFVDGNIPEADALIELEEPTGDLFICLCEERDRMDNLIETISSGQNVDKIKKCVYELDDADDNLKTVVEHLKNNDANYHDLIEVYIKSAITHIKKAIEK